MDNNKNIMASPVLQEALLNDREFLRNIVADFCQDLLQEEMKAHLKAEKYERTDERSGLRNGYKPRTIKTRVGSFTLLVPQDRDGSFSTALFERYSRSEKALVLTMMEAYILGVSTRKVSGLTEILCGTTFSASTVSNLSRALDSRIAVFKERPLSKEYPYVFVDATYIKARIDENVISQGVVIVVGIDSKGYREILDIEVANSETYETYDRIFKSLRQRGLSGVSLLISDDHMGLKKALFKHFQGTLWQRCVFHFTRNMLDLVPRKKRAYVYSDLKTVFLCSSKDEALLRAKALADRYESQYPALAQMLREDIIESLTYMDFPIEHRARIRTTNVIERLNGEIKRRTNVVRIFPNPASALRLIASVCMEQNEEWVTGKKYLNMEYLKNLNIMKKIKENKTVLTAVT
jgi:putative transposase